MKGIFAINVAAAALLVSSAARSAEPTSLQPVLPPIVTAVVGQEQHIYFENVVLSPLPDGYRFECACDVGEAGARDWHVKASAAQVGDHILKMATDDLQGKPIGTAQTIVRIIPADAGHDRSLRLLIVGDSLTHATRYPNRLATLLNEPGNPKWTMLGTHRPVTTQSAMEAALPGVGHEGYGGWSWGRFVNWYDPKPEGNDRTSPHWWSKVSSPFVFRGANERPQLDVPRYFKEHCDNEPPDMVIFLLGINDLFRADASTPAAIDASIDRCFTDADRLLAAFHAAAPRAVLGVGLVTPRNTSDAAFTANYPGSVTRQQWRTVRQRLVEREIEHFSGRGKEAIDLIPTEMGIDPINGFPPNNALHPNARGYDQLGDCIYAWIKSVMARPLR